MFLQVLISNFILKHVRPVAGGADQDEEEGVDGEGVEDGYDGAFRDGHTRSLQLAFRGRANIRRFHDCLYMHRKIYNV